MGERVVAHLPPADWKAEVAVGEDRSADLNHWTHFMGAWNALKVQHPQAGHVSTFWVTHVDDYFKLKMVQELCEAGYYAICLSSETMNMLAREGVQAQRVTYVVPAGDDVGPLPPIKIGLASRCYPDGRKNEKWLLKLCADSDIRHFEFHIWGAGWEEVVAAMTQRGAKVVVDSGTKDSRADYQRLLAGLQSCDYSIYLGWDEGALGTIDAIKLGVKTIVSRQGFHTDLAFAIDHLFGSYEELRSILRELAGRRAAREKAVKLTTWEAYSRSHQEIWSCLLNGKCLPPNPYNPGRIFPAPTLTASLGKLHKTRSSFLRYLGMDRLKDSLRPYLKRRKA
jgi:hypothetical protein